MYRQIFAFLISNYYLLLGSFFKTIRYEFHYFSRAFHFLAGLISLRKSISCNNV